MSNIIIYIAFLQLITLPMDSFEIKVTVNNIKEKDGKLMVAVYQGEENYRENALSETTIPVKSTGSQEFTLSLPEGEYSIAVFQDLNDNEELDKNLMGMPQEPFGFTNKSMGTLGAPSYEDTKFKVDKDDTSVVVDLKHL